jgi:hypothetical protein
MPLSQRPTKGIGVLAKLLCNLCNRPPCRLLNLRCNKRHHKKPEHHPLPPELLKPLDNPARARFLLALWKGHLDPSDRRFRPTVPLTKFLDPKE